MSHKYWFLLYHTLLIVMINGQYDGVSSSDVFSAPLSVLFFIYTIFTLLIAGPYFGLKTWPHLKEIPPKGRYKILWTETSKMERCSFVIEIVDVITDFIAANIIIRKGGPFVAYGIVSLCATVIGGICFVSKIYLILRLYVPFHVWRNEIEICCDSLSQGNVHKFIEEKYKQKHPSHISSLSTSIYQSVATNPMQHKKENAENKTEIEMMGNTEKLIQVYKNQYDKGNDEELRKEINDRYDKINERQCDVSMFDLFQAALEDSMQMWCILTVVTFTSSVSGWTVLKLCLNAGMMIWKVYKGIIMYFGGTQDARDETLAVAYNIPIHLIEKANACKLVHDNKENESDDDVIQEMNEESDKSDI